MPRRVQSSFHPPFRLRESTENGSKGAGNDDRLRPNDANRHVCHCRTAGHYEQS